MKSLFARIIDRINQHLNTWIARDEQRDKDDVQELINAREENTTDDDEEREAP